VEARRAAPRRGAERLGNLPDRPAGDPANQLLRFKQNLPSRFVIQELSLLKNTDLEKFKRKNKDEKNLIYC